MWQMKDDNHVTYGFVQAFRFREYQDLSSFSKRLKEGITICSPKYIAGPEHVRRILVQANEYWKREITLARNRSIDLLMRITCQSQIASALKFSNLSHTKQIAIFGLSQSASDAEQSCSAIISLGAIRDDDLLRLTAVRKRFLSKFHNLPENYSVNKIIDYLEEESVLLAFSK